MLCVVDALNACAHICLRYARTQHNTTLLTHTTHNTQHNAHNTTSLTCQQCCAQHCALCGAPCVWCATVWSSLCVELLTWLVWSSLCVLSGWFGWLWLGDLHRAAYVVHADTRPTSVTDLCDTSASTPRVSPDIHATSTCVVHSAAPLPTGHAFGQHS